MTPAPDTPASVMSRPVDSLKPGPSRLRALKSLGIATLGDLLEYFPRRYQHETAELPVRGLTDGPIQIARGTVCAVDYIPSRPRPRFEATLDDGTGKLALSWFNSAYLRTKIHPGMLLRVQGRVRFFRNLPSMANPRWEAIEQTAEPVAEAGFRPVYPASGKLSSEAIERLIAENLDALLPEVHEWFDPALLESRRLMGRREAYRSIHRPADETQAAAARRRIVYDELMLMQLGLGLSRRLRDGRLAAPLMRLDRLLDQRIRARFPFPLTDAQEQAVRDIVLDLQSGRPMNRLLQGDVGSGKTVVALYAMLVGVTNRLQSALLAPTEVLAEQHYLTLTNLLRDSKVSIELFTSRTGRRDRERFKRLADGTIHLAVGTQALIQPNVEFANLGLVVVDEQHRLGVRQRAVLRGKGLSPHYLVMTATPIPRTLALSYFADFDVTTIDALPPGRQPIRTSLLRPPQADRAYELVRREVAAGRQAYIVLARIDDDDLDQSRGVVRECERLANGPLRGLRLEMLHGRMPTDQKQAVMTAFRDRTVDVLVATTVIEVGIDVPNATVMIIDGAERFGLSQLHQLRGRVGRGDAPSVCILISDAAGEQAESRLAAMTRTSDGFDIARMDLELRGPGEFFGVRQHGLPEFKLVDLRAEITLLEQARDDARRLLDADPRLTLPVHRHLRDALRARLGETVTLAQIG